MHCELLLGTGTLHYITGTNDIVIIIIIIIIIIIT